jgi:hypothetical protein
MRRVRRFALICGVCALAVAPASARAQGWSPVPPADFATLQLSQFADHELEVPFFLRHFAQVANSVVENTTTIDGVTYPRGFLNIRVNREPKDNLPHNARILEMQAVLAYFYTADRPWNPYRGNAAVRQRLEAMLNLWTQMQAPDGHPSAGLFTEYSATNWSLAPTSFGAMHAAQALDLIVDSGLPFDPAVLESARIALRRALMAMFTRPDMRAHARSWSNQFSGSYHAALIYLENWPDAELDAAFVQAVNDSAAQDQSPAGFFYEQDGPDFGYSGVHDNNLRVAWPRLKNRADLAPVIIGDDVKWNDWLAANYVLQPGLATNTFLTSAGLNTRTSHSVQTPRSRPLAEFATNSRAFALTDTEYAASLAAKRASEQARFGNYGNLSVPSAYSYNTGFVFDAAAPGGVSLNSWHPTAAQRDAAIAALPSRGTSAVNRIFHNPTPSSGAFSLAAVNRTNYYATFALGNRRIPRQVYGLNLLWNRAFGLALQPVANTISNNAFQWGTSRGTNTPVTYETANMPGTIRLGTNTVTPVAGVTNLPNGDLSLSYALSSGGTNFGQKNVTLGASNVSVVLTHTNVFTEVLPLAYASDAALSNSPTRLVLTRPNGSSFLLQLNSAGGSINAGSAASLTSGMVRRVVTITATNSLSYTLAVSDTAPPAESSTPSVSASDAAVAQPLAGTTNAAVQVSLSASPSSPVTVNFSTQNGSAMAGTDYTATSGTLTFSPGETSKSVSIPVAAGTLPQGAARVFGLRLSGPAGATLGRDTANVTINGSFAAPPSVSVSDAAANQPLAGAAATNMVFNITLSSAAAVPVSVGFTTQDGEEGLAGVHYTQTNGTLSFAAGQTNRTISVPVLPGALEVGRAVDFFLQLTSISGAGLADDSARGVINGATPPPPPPAGSARLEFVFSNAWPGNYQGFFRLINNSTVNITDWRADFDFAGTLITFFNGTLSGVGLRRTFTPLSWQAYVAAGTTFENTGFQAQPGGEDDFPKNIVLRVLSASNLAPLQIATPSNLGSFAKGALFQQVVQTGGGLGPFTWSLAPGHSLPAGLTLSPSGVISGTTAAAGLAMFDLRVTDLMGTTATKSFALEVLPPPDPFDTWRDGHAWNGADYSAGADPDRDGLNNLAEYALGTSPLTPGAEPSVFMRDSADGPRLVLGFHRISDPALTYRVFATSLLHDWGAPVWTSAGTENIHGPVEVADPQPAGDHAQRFMRLEIMR